MLVNKNNDTIDYNYEINNYCDAKDNTKYVSVTTLINNFLQPFDKEFWSSYKALSKLTKINMDAYKLLIKTKKFNSTVLSHYNVSENDFKKAKEEILKEWELNSKQSCERGKAIHAKLEKEMYESSSNVILKKFGLRGNFECKRNYHELDIPYGIYPEYLVCRKSKDNILRLVGKIDLLIKNGNEIIICDYKTNAKIDLKSKYDALTKQYSKMRYPLNNLDDCDYIHYTLLLSTYAWMIQKLNPNYIIKDLILIHYDHDGHETIYHVDYLKTEVERMLTFHKKLKIREIQRERLKPIEY